MEVDLGKLRSAMLCWPTRTGQAMLNRAFAAVEAKAVLVTGRRWHVDATTWQEAMNLCASVPCGGRWVWQARQQLRWGIDRARWFNKEKNDERHL